MCAGFAQAASADGSFESNDSLVNLIWRNSVQTARDMVSPPVNLDRRGCDIDLADDPARRRPSATAARTSATRP